MSSKINEPSLVNKRFFLDQMQIYSWFIVFENRRPMHFVVEISSTHVQYTIKINITNIYLLRCGYTPKERRFPGVARKTNSAALHCFIAFRTHLAQKRHITYIFASSCFATSASFAVTLIACETILVKNKHRCVDIVWSCRCFVLYEVIWKPNKVNGPANAHPCHHNHCFDTQTKFVPVHLHTCFLMDSTTIFEQDLSPRVPTLFLVSLRSWV